MARFTSSLLVLSSLSCAALAAPALMSSARAQTDAATPPAADASGMAAFQFSGLINADNVYIRSGSSENDYAVMRLNKGDTVVVVGQANDWLKILPPEGSVCLIGQMWVDARGDGTTGRVQEDKRDVNVRISSNINDSLAKVIATVNGGSDVKILGKKDEFYKIAPPPGAFLYVSKRFVDVVKRVAVVQGDGKMEVKAATDSPVAPPPATMPAADNGMANAGGPNLPDVTPPNVQPATEPAVAVVPATMPSAEAQAAFDSLETRFADASGKPIADQPIAELLSGYKMLAADKTMPDSFGKTADNRMKALTTRQELYAQFQKTQADQQAAAARQLPAVAEAKEIEQRIKESEVKRYAAVGALHTSALPYNGVTLYRLTDPASGRTVVYVVTADPAIKAMEGQFVGIKGDVTEDTVRKIRYIQPTAAEAVEPGDLAKGSATSGLLPPSMAASTASGQ